MSTRFAADNSGRHLTLTEQSVFLEGSCGDDTGRQESIRTQLKKFTAALSAND